MSFQWTEEEGGKMWRGTLPGRSVKARVEVKENGPDGYGWYLYISGMGVQLECGKYSLPFFAIDSANAIAEAFLKEVE
jgi:hypothetical protein